MTDGLDMLEQRGRGQARSAPAPQRGDRLVHIDPQTLHPDPDNPRGEFDDDAEFEASVAQDGILDPLLVSHELLIVAGHRRQRAAIRVGRTTVPCLVREVDATQVAVLRMVENIQRVNLDPIQEARGYARLRDLGLGVGEIAHAVHTSQAGVSKRLALLDLPADLQAQVRSGEIGSEDAYDLSRVAARVPGQLDAALERVAEGATVGQAVSEIIPRRHRRSQPEEVESAGKISQEFSTGSAAAPSEPVTAGAPTTTEIPIDPNLVVEGRAPASEPLTAGATAALSGAAESAEHRTPPERPAHDGLNLEQIPAEGFALRVGLAPVLRSKTPVPAVQLLFTHGKVETRETLRREDAQRLAAALVHALGAPS